MHNKECCTFLRGSIYLSKYIDPCSGFDQLGCNEDQALFCLGNVAQATLTINSTQLGSDTYNNHVLTPQKTKLSINSVNLNMSVTCSSDKNLIEFLGLDVKNLESGTELKRYSCTLKKGEVLIFKKNPTDLTLTLRSSDGSSVRVLTEDIDYILNNEIVTLIQDISDNYSYLEASYSFDESSNYDLFGLENFSNTYRIMFRGVNYADGVEKDFDVEIYKCRLSFLPSLDLISDGSFLNLSLQGRVERDLSRECQGKDAYFKISKTA